MPFSFRSLVSSHSGSTRSQVRWQLAGMLAGVALLGGCASSQEDGSTVGEGAGAVAAPQSKLGSGQGPIVEAAVRDTALQVSLSLDKTSYTPTENPIATVTLKNVSLKSVKLLSWYLPNTDLEEDLFRVDSNDEPVAFMGPHFKRQAPQAGDFVTLAPGQSLTRTVELSRFYDLGDTGEYKVRFEAEALQLRGIEAGLGKVVVSNEVRVWVEGRTMVPPWQEESNTDLITAGSLTYSKCSSSQQPTVKQAYDAANVYSDGAATYLNGSPSATNRYVTWFGTYSLNGWNTAKSHFLAIQDAYDNKAVVIDCSCKKVGVYAYVYANQPYKIYVCGAFWNAPLTGTDSKGGTLIHEMSHFTVVAGTDDWAYGQTDAKALAKSDPAKALDNADNHEYFAENNPALN